MNCIGGNMTQAKKVGFIGLGSMGKAMATNILKAGFPLTVYDVRPEPVAELEKIGARATKTVTEVGAKSDAVVVMVLNYHQVREVTLPPEGLLSSIRRGATLIVTSTITPQNITELAQAAGQYEVEVIDSPVSGGHASAEAGTLSLMAGGKEEVVKQHWDILKAIGGNVFHVGKVGQGQAVKVINQILVSANIASLAEALVMAKKLGLDLNSVLNVISKSAGDSFVLKSMGPQMVAGDFKPRATIDIFCKDTQCIMDTALALDVPLLISSLNYQVYRMARAKGLGKEDASALFQFFAEFAGL
jgi:2-hydroxymethylglutarate dehydrogenase